MSSYDNENRYQKPVTQDLEVFRKELESIQWITSSLNQLERVTSCKRRDALKSALVAKLESPDSPYVDFASFLTDHSKVLTENAQLQREVTRLKTELAERPTREIVKFVPQEAVSSEPSTRSVQQKPSGPGCRPMIMTIFVIGLLVYYLLVR
jgi:hypothetical protein